MRRDWAAGLKTTLIAFVITIPLSAFTFAQRMTPISLSPSLDGLRAKNIKVRTLGGRRHFHSAPAGQLVRNLNLILGNQSSKRRCTSKFCVRPEYASLPARSLGERSIYWNRTRSCVASSSGAFDFDQRVFRRDYALEATRTRGHFYQDAKC